MIEQTVVVAGAGPVGLVTALKLARAGIPVTVVDAEPDILQGPRAVVYHSPTVEELDKLGVLDDMKAVGILKQEYQFRTLDGDILAAPHMSVLHEGDTAYPYNLHLAQHVLAGILLRHFMRVPGATIRWSTRVSAVEPDEHGATITAETLD